MIIPTPTKEHLARCLALALEHLDNAIHEAERDRRDAAARYKWQDGIEAEARLFQAEDLQLELAGHLAGRDLSQDPFAPDALVAELRTIAGPSDDADPLVVPVAEPDRNPHDGSFGGPKGE